MRAAKRTGYVGTAPACLLATAPVSEKFSPMSRRYFQNRTQQNFENSVARGNKTPAWCTYTCDGDTYAKECTAAAGGCGHHACSNRHAGMHNMRSSHKRRHLIGFTKPRYAPWCVRAPPLYHSYSCKDAAGASVLQPADTSTPLEASTHPRGTLCEAFTNPRGDIGKNNVASMMTTTVEYNTRGANGHVQ